MILLSKTLNILLIKSASSSPLLVVELFFSYLFNKFNGNLTNAGYDYLEQIRSPKIWEDTKIEIEKNKLPNTIQSIAAIAGSFTGAALKELINP